MTKSSDRAVVIGSAPLAENVGKTVYINLCADRSGIIEKQFFAVAFALSVLAVFETTA